MVRIAMAAHPEYDDRYWRYVENLSAESRGAKLQITNEESALWSIHAVGGELTVKYRIHLPSQTTPNRSAYMPFLSPTGGLIGDVHSLMYVVGAELTPTTIRLELPNGWKSASGLESIKDQEAGGRRREAGPGERESRQGRQEAGAQTFAASSVELLLDSPIVVGEFQQWDFEVQGLKHQVIYLTQPNAAAFDSVAFVAGIQKLVIEALKIDGEAPYKH